MLFVGAILLAVFVLDAPWSFVVVAVAAVVEIGESFFWVWLSRRRGVQMGPETLIGATGQVVTPCRPSGQVRVQGELWQARCEMGVDVGERVRVTALDGLILHVEPE